MVPVPRAKKLPGQAVDRRNGQQAVLPAETLRKFALPKRADGLKYDQRTQRMWRALWEDDRLSSVLAPVDRELVARWAQAVDDQIKALALAWENPVTTGSMDQDVPSPYFAIAKQAESTAQACEAQIGVGALNRARLGIAILAEQRSLLDLSDGFPGDQGGDGEPDPRLS
jgi:hypothetical protein